MNILKDMPVITRKPHLCWGCGVVYPTGTTMQYVVSKDGGDFCYAYWCDTCNKFMATLEPWELEDGFPCGTLLEYDNYPKSEVQP